jgi:hypothetical protein
MMLTRAVLNYLWSVRKPPETLDDESDDDLDNPNSYSVEFTFEPRFKRNYHPGFCTTTQATMLVSLTVGKVDAGMAVLLTEDKRIVRNSYIGYGYL